MLMFRKYSPRFTMPGEIEAKRYANQLFLPSIIATFLLRMPMAQWVAALLAAALLLCCSVALLLRAIVAGKAFRMHEPEFASQVPFWKRLWIMKQATRFVLVSTVSIAVAMGLTEWQGTVHTTHTVLESLMLFKVMNLSLWS